jgi:hypothetical protein
MFFGFFKKKVLKYSHLTFTYFERLILPSVLKKDLKRLKGEV